MIRHCRITIQSCAEHLEYRMIGLKTVWFLSDIELLTLEDVNSENLQPPFSIMSVLFNCISK